MAKTLNAFRYKKTALLICIIIILTIIIIRVCIINSIKLHNSNCNIKEEISRTNTLVRSSPVINAGEDIRKISMDIVNIIQTNGNIIKSFETATSDDVGEYCAYKLIITFGGEYNQLIEALFIIDTYSGGHILISQCIIKCEENKSQRGTSLICMLEIQTIISSDI